MVQRKVPNNKLGIQRDHHHVITKPENHLDVKGRGADLKKKVMMMKKKSSASIKLPEFETIRSPDLRRHTIQPGKPPPLSPSPPPRPSGFLVLPATPQKQAQVKAKAMDTTPNYMKSTSSFAARTGEKPTQVSSKRAKTTSFNRAKIGSVSCQKKAKSQTKTSSLKMMRSLVKTPSFKPARVSVKKCPPVLLNEDLDVKRATCSSTLKDSKFPSYLSLNPGGTKSDGTSIMKVCPYNYCSLNGHHRPRAPPLKCFLSARRRAMKAQRSAKIGPSSPKRARPVGEVLNSEKEADFFVEIHTVLKKDSGVDQAETGKGNEDQQVLEDFSDWPEVSDNDSGNDIDQNSDIDSTELRSRENVEVEKMASVEFDGQDSEASDMEWEAGETSVLCYFDDSENSSEKKEENGLKEDDLNRFRGFNFSLDDKMSSLCDDDQGPEESFAEESVESETWVFQNYDCEVEETYNDHQKTEFPQEENEVEMMGNQGSDISHGLDERNQNDGLNEAYLGEMTQWDEQSVLPDCNDSEINGQNCEGDDGTYSNQAEKGPDSGDQETCINEAEIIQLIEDTSKTRTENAYSERNSFYDLSDIYKKLRQSTKCKRAVEEYDELSQFNPRAPNFLPLEPDPEADKVDLRHQMTDDRKNAEEWMLDYALRQAVTKLAPARQRKVALLVEAFETVLPISKCESRVSHSSTEFASPRRIQACS